MDVRMLFALLGGLSSGFAFLTLPPALDLLMSLYGVSYTGISILLSAVIWSHAAMQIPSGLVADRLGVRRALALGFLFILIGNLVPILATSYQLAMIGRVLTGFGTSLVFITSLKLAALQAPKDRIGTFQAFTAGCFSLGSIIAYLILPRIVTFGWQWTFLVPVFCTLPLLLILSKLTMIKAPEKVQTMAVLGRVSRMPSVWIVGILHSLCWGTIVSLGNWIPSLLAELWNNAAAGRFAWGGALGMLASGIGRWMGGFFLFRISPLSLGRGAVLILIFVFLGLFLISDPFITLCLTLAATWFASINFGALFHLASKSASVDSQATIFGMVNFLANLGAILFTILFGWFKETLGSFEWGFVALAIWAVFGYTISRSMVPIDRKKRILT